MDKTFLIPASWIIIVIAIRCISLGWRIWKARSVTPLLFLLPRLFLLVVYTWVELTNPMIEAARLFVRWGLFVLFTTEVSNDIIFWRVKKHEHKS